MAIELDRFGPLLESQDDVDVAGPAAAERDGFLSMGGAGGALGAPRNIDMAREEPLAEDRLIGPGHRDEIPEVESAGAARRRATFADKDDIKRETHRVAGAIAFSLDLAQQAVKCDPRRLVRLAGREQGGLGEGFEDRSRRTGTRLQNRPRRGLGGAEPAGSPAAAGQREQADHSGPARALRPGRIAPHRGPPATGARAETGHPRPDQSVL